MGGRCVGKRSFIYIGRILLFLYTEQKELLSRKYKRYRRESQKSNEIKRSGRSLRLKLKVGDFIH